MLYTKYLLLYYREESKGKLIPIYNALNMGLERENIRRRQSTSYEECSIGYRSDVKLNIILLDWEKAFDKVSHEAMHAALERMNLPIKYLDILRELYKKTQFQMEIDGKKSEWKTQGSSIRQGCPLSPYLFLILMTVMFHDIRKNETLTEELKEDRITRSAI